MTTRGLLRPLLSRQLKTHRIWRGALGGYKIVASWHDYPAAILGYAEKSLVDWLLENVKPGETWVDVGAHYGYVSIALSAAVGSSGRVYSFEPHLATAGCLAQTRVINGLSQMTVVPLALSDDGELTERRFPTIRGMIDSQLQEGDAFGQSQVLCASFDKLWTMTFGRALTLHGVKIDVQGMEIETVRGMRSTLMQQKPKLIIEVHKSVDRRELLKLLDECDYDRRPIPIEKGIETQFDDPHSNYSFLFVPA